MADRRPNFEITSKYSTYKFFFSEMLQEQHIHRTGETGTYRLYWNAIEGELTWSTMNGVHAADYSSICTEDQVQRLHEAWHEYLVSEVILGDVCQPTPAADPSSDPVHPFDETREEDS
jgi:hypothetical protein